jgi:hypothetical protein
MRWIFIFIFSGIKFSDANCHRPLQGDLITVPASQKYSSPSLVEKVLFGTNYRKEWGTPVTMPVFDLRKTNFKIVRMGGGQQTTSLELADDNNREWVLRSVDKNVKPPNKLTGNKFIRNIIQDHVSGSYPYAGLSIPVIANAVGVSAGGQHLFYVPDDEVFGEHRSVMRNKVFMLVNHEPQITEGVTTDKMMEKLKTNSHYYVDQKEYLKARLLDWLIADWDRHVGQWRWIEKKTDSGTAFLIQPRDRDQAFYRSNGLLAGFVGLFFMPHLNKFNHSGRGIKGLSKKSRTLDKQFTNKLSEDDWEGLVKEFQKKVTDSVIETAIKRQPKEIFVIRGNELISKLKSRRDGLLKHVMKYMIFLERQSE